MCVGSLFSLLNVLEKFGLLQIPFFFSLSNWWLWAGEGAKSRGMSIEKKIEFLESLTGNVFY